MKAISTFVVLLLAALSCYAGREGQGGDLQKGNPGEAQVRYVLEKIQVPVTYALQFVGNKNRSKPGFIGAEKIYGTKDGRDIYWFIQNAKIEIKNHGPCRSHGKDKDASVDKEQNTICFSVERLTDKLDAVNFFAELVALAAHEYSHFMDTNEEEADFIQGVIRGRVTANAGYNYQRMPEELKEQLTSLSDDIVALRSVAGPSAPGTQVKYLGAVGLQVGIIQGKAQRLNALMVELWKSGLQPFTDDTEVQINGILMRLHNLNNFVLPLESQGTFWMNTSADSLPLATYAKSRGFLTGNYRGTIYRVGYLDVKGLNKDTADILENISMATSAIQ